jgi:hypothetical protein
MGKFRYILRPHEWIGFGVGVALAAAIYLVLIHPSLRLVGLEEHAANQRTRTEKELAQLRTEYQQLRAGIGDYHRRLREVGGSPPLASEKDRQIARVTALANLCGVRVDQYSPIETLDQADHQEVLLQFAGRATYAEIVEFFRRIETEIDFVDVTHFSITRTQQEGVRYCQVNWSCRVTGMRPQEPRDKAPEGNMVSIPAAIGREGDEG